MSRRTPLTKNEINAILDLHRQGLPALAIFKAAGVCRGTVYSHLRKRGLKLNWNGRGRRISRGGSIICRKCNTPKEKDCYWPTDSMCKPCRAASVTSRSNSSTEMFLRRRCRQLRWHAARKGVQFSLVPRVLIDLFNAQSGKCFYTDFPMRCVAGEEKRWDTLSVDQIAPRAGYVPGNIVLCTLRANRMKNDLPQEWLERFLPSFWTRIAGLALPPRPPELKARP